MIPPSLVLMCSRSCIFCERAKRPYYTMYLSAKLNYKLKAWLLLVAVVWILR